MRKLRYFIAFFAITVLLIIFNGFEVYYIDSRSMESTLLVGDRVLVRNYRHKRAVRKSEIANPEKLNGQVLVFKNPEYQLNKYFIKRCIASSGDTIL